MAKLDELVVEISAQTQGLRTELGRAEKAVGGFSGNLKSKFSSIKDALFSVQGVLSALTAGALFEFGKTAIEAFAEAEQATAKLNAVLESTGRAGNKASEGIQKSAEALMAITTFDDDAIVQATATLASFAKTLTGPELQQAQSVIVGLATKLGVDLDTAARLVAKTLNGNTAALGRYGIEVDKAATPSQKLAQLQSQVSESLDVAKKKTETLTGALEQVNNQWTNTLERIGALIAKNAGVQNFLKDWADALKNLNKFLDDNQSSIQGVIDSVFKFGDSLGWLIAKPIIRTIEIFKQFRSDLGNVKRDFVQMLSEVKTRFDQLTASIDGAIRKLTEFFKKKAQETKEKNAKAGIYPAAYFSGGGGGFAQASNGLQQIQSQGQSVFSSLESSVKQFGSSFANVFSNINLTGKFQFKDLLNNIVGMLQNIGQNLIQNGLSNLFSSLFSGGRTSSVVPNFAQLFTGIPLTTAAGGGDLFANRPALVGEKGPELFIPKAAGGVIPTHKLPKSGNTTIVLHQHFSLGVSETVRSEIAAATPGMMRAARDYILGDIQRGGKMARAVGARS